MITALNEIPVEHRKLIPLNQLEGHFKGFYVNGAVYLSPERFKKMEHHSIEYPEDLQVIDVEHCFGEDRRHFFGIDLKNDLDGDALHAHVMRIIRTDALIRSGWLPQSIQSHFTEWANKNVSSDNYINDRSYYSANDLYRYWLEFHSIARIQFGALKDFSSDHLQLECDLTKKWLADQARERKFTKQAFACIGAAISIVTIILIYFNYSIKP